VQPEPVQPEPVQPEPVQHEPVQPEPVQPEPVQPEPVQPEPVQPEPVQPEPVQPVPLQPVPLQPVPLQPVPLQHVPLSTPSLPSEYVASAPPAVGSGRFASLPDDSAAQDLFDDPMQSVAEPSQPVEELAQPQCTPVPVEATKGPRLTIRTPIEGVPELHQSALKDTPNLAALPPTILLPPTHMEGVPETNVHLPLPSVWQQTCEVESLPSTPPSQIEGVPEVHLSAWRPAPPCRLVPHEDNSDTSNISCPNASAHAAADDGTPPASISNASCALASEPPPPSRITHPTQAPGLSYVIPDHPVLLRSNPSPVMSPRSRLIRESAEGGDSPIGDNAPVGMCPAVFEPMALAIPSCADNISSHPSAAEGSISLNENAGAAVCAGGGTDAEVSTKPWYTVPTGLTPEGYVNMAVGTTPASSALPSLLQGRAVVPSSDPPSGGTHQCRAATQSQPSAPLSGTRTRRGRSAKRKSDADVLREGGSSKRTRSARHSSANSADAASDVGDRPQNVSVADQALGVRDGRRWGPQGEGCSHWLESSSGAGAARDAGPENAQNLWCGDEFGGGDDFGDEYDAYIFLTHHGVIASFGCCFC
jgi:hypothetical protein